MIGRAIPGRNFFSVPSPVAECSNGKGCSHCASKIHMSRKVRGCIEPVVECIGKWATIKKILRNPVLAAMEIFMIQDENRRLHRQLARVLLFNATHQYADDS